MQLFSSNLSSCGGQADGQLPGEREAEAGAAAHELTRGEVQRSDPLTPGSAQDAPRPAGEKM
jgi:hypothetical protein